MQRRPFAHVARSTLLASNDVGLADVLPCLLNILWTRPAASCASKRHSSYASSNTRSSRSKHSRTNPAIQSNTVSSRRTLGGIFEGQGVHNDDGGRNTQNQNPRKTKRKLITTRSRQRVDQQNMLASSRVTRSPRQGLMYLNGAGASTSESGDRDGLLAKDGDDGGKESRLASGNRLTAQPLLADVRKPYSIAEKDRYRGKSTTQLRRSTVDDPEPALPQAHKATRPLLLTLDAFDTVFTPRDAIAEQYCTVAARHGVNADAVVVKADFRTAFKRMSDLHPNYGGRSHMTPQKWWTQVIEQTFPTSRYPTLSKTTRDALVKDLYRRFSCSEGYRLFPDVRPFLEHIGTSFQASTWAPRRTMLGILSNSDPRVRRILQAFQINIKPALFPPRFAPWNRYQSGPDFGPARPAFATLSYEAGIEKPDPAFFHQALVDAQHALVSLHAVARLTRSGKDLLTNIVTDFHHMHVGDSLTKDVIPAIKAGWDGVWLDRSSGEDIKEVLVDEAGNVQDDPATGHLSSTVPLHGFGDGEVSPQASKGEQPLFRVTAINALTVLPRVVTKERLEGAFFGAKASLTSGSESTTTVESDLKWVVSRFNQVDAKAGSPAPATSRRAQRRGLGIDLKHASSSRPELRTNRWGQEEITRLMEFD
ncbi:hypothetical protein FH972_022795 [Carpinus fangiana]|uniref:Uncharacterized protein n=1 Tax=Carpinus fangiana TaxID=176857 RepID=A0A5N6KTS3_9ROSI|nr:hypothetical protein FH972_022795 [Carpinus fangiana]